MYSKVYLEISNICNKSCSFCPTIERKASSLSYEQFDMITDKLIGITKYLYLHVMGEPLLHERVCDFIECATKKGFKVIVTTNGTLLPERGEDIIKAGVYKVNVSVHSFEDGTDEEYFNYLGGCIEFAKKASDRGVLTVLRLWNKGCDGGRNERTEKMLRTIDGEWTEGRRGIKIKDGLYLEYGDRFEWPSVQNQCESDSVFCYGLKDQFAILSNGTVVPCCLDCEGVINLGNAFTDDLSIVLSSKRAVAIREGFKNRKAVEELCKKCPYARRF